MRTSGAATESRMTFAIFVIALGVIVLINGGPRNVMVACEQALHRVAEAIYQAYLSFQG